MNQICSKYQVSPTPPGHAHRVERQKLDMRTGVEIAVGVRKVDLVKKQVLVRILAPNVVLEMLYEINN